MTHVEQLTKKVAAYVKKESLEVINTAYQYAYQAHQGQKRISGEDYITHPVGVAGILADIELDVQTIVAALLHDLVEDTPVTVKDITQTFGSEVALLVNGVTKLKRLEKQTQTEQQADNLRKMFLAMAEDIRVILIKLADRLHNMRTLHHLDEDRQKKVAKETLEIFAPLAHRLGISRIQWELEDLSFLYLEPQRYHEIARRVQKKRAEREQIINEAIYDLKENLNNVDIVADIQGRPKHFYSIYRKMYMGGRDFSEIYDLTAIRVMVGSIKDCYGALGVIHTMWKPIPGRFKDYVAMPKSNMYQSLHTTVISERGDPFEIQIRTVAMHQTAEYGIAAHWRYKEGGQHDINFEEKLAWLRQILEWQQELRDAEEFMDGLKIELFSDQVFVFTPKGDVIDLPSGSTPIDFAYRIHTEVGHRCVGAKINGRIVPLTYKLQNGDIVEILTTKIPNGPSRDWLNVVKTSQAKSRIRHWFKREQRAENIEKGASLLEKEIKKLGYTLAQITEDKAHPFLEELIEDMNYLSSDDLMAAIGFGTDSAVSIARKLVEEYKKRFEQVDILKKRMFDQDIKDLKPQEGVAVRGIDNALISFAKCCSPVPGDSIVGYVTRGRGVSIHAQDCPNIKARANEPGRFIDVEWDDDEGKRYPVRLAVSGHDRPGVLHDVMGVVSEKQINIVSFYADTDVRNQVAVIYMTIEVKNVVELEQIIQHVEAIPEIHSVRRVKNE